MQRSWNWTGMPCYWLALADQENRPAAAVFPPGGRCLAEDEALVLVDRAEGFCAHPFPTWKNHLTDGPNPTYNLKAHVPVAAVFFLNGWDDDRVAEIGQRPTAARINRSSTQICFMHLDNLQRAEQTEWRRRMFQNGCGLAQRVPAYLLRVTATGRFWENMEEVLTKLGRRHDQEGAIKHVV